MLKFSFDEKKKKSTFISEHFSKSQFNKRSRKATLVSFNKREILALTGTIILLVHLWVGICSRYEVQTSTNVIDITFLSISYSKQAMLCMNMLIFSLHGCRPTIYS